MEKIQNAIAKARAERGQAATGQGNISRHAEVDPAAALVSGKDGGQQDGHEAAWQALPLLQPDPARMGDNRIVAFSGGHEAVSFDVMRTKLLQQMRAHNWRRVAITSPSPGCGKSTIALNLAFSIARQAEMRTVLAELDLRRPSLAAMLGIQGRKSFAHVLQGRANFAEAAVRYGDGLALAVNDGPVRNPAELLHGSAVPTALATIEANYAPDLMLFDMPPMLVSDDTMAFMSHVDAVLLIAAAETTTIKEVDACERELASQTNVMGVVLNKCRYMGPEYGYSYYA